jgi:hypothetical protein
MAKAVICIVDDRQQAEAIVSSLQSAGFAANDISVLFPDKDGSRDFAHEKGTKAPEGAAAGAATGGVIGGTLGWLAGIGSLAIPGVGPFVAAGPILAALSGAAIGASTAGVAGALIGLGVPEYEAKQYDAKIRGGNLLISVHTDDGDAQKRAKDIFERHNASDISVAGEEGVDRQARTGAPEREASRLP